MKALKIPNNVKIGGLIYKVKYLDQCADAGSFDPNAMEITLERNTPERMMSTFLHELIEGVNHEGSLNLEHDTINRLEHMLFQVFTDNKINFS